MKHKRGLTRLWRGLLPTIAPSEHYDPFADNRAIRLATKERTGTKAERKRRRKRQQAARKANR